MVNYEIKTEPDPNFPSCVRQTVRIGSKKVETPIKSIELSSISLKTKLDKNTYGFNEIHKKLYEKTKLDKKGRIRTYSVEDLQKSPYKFGKFNWGLSSIYKRRKLGINMCFVEWVGDNYPNNETIKLMATIAYCYSDVIPIPIITNLRKKFENNPSEIKLYLNFLDEICNEINIKNEKPIMGIIPNLTFPLIKSIMDFYVKKEKELKHEVRFFYFDFDGVYPESASLNIENVLRRLKEEEILNESFIHSLNANMGKMSQKKDVIPTKDIMSFAYRFGSLGKYKAPNFIPPLPPLGKGDEDQKKMVQNRLRIFRKEDYGCYKVTTSDALEEVYPEDSSIPLEKLYSSLKGKKIDYKTQKLFNMEQQGLESCNLREIIINQECKEYFENKEYVDKTELKKIKKIHSTLES